MKNLLKKLIPEKLLKLVRPLYHGILAWDASIYFDRPSERLIVIGITGTAGKSTTAAMLSHILNFAGLKTGYITTVDFFDGTRHFMNKHGLSMPNEIKLQKQLHAMAVNKCEVGIIECTSEGLAQDRHWGINFDMAVFTNMSRAHLESHGSFGNYQKAKGKLFAALAKGKKKKFFPQKMIGANFDDPMSGYFLSFPADKKFGVSFNGLKVSDSHKTFYANLTKYGVPVEFTMESTLFNLNMPGNFNAQNAGLAAACAGMLGVSLEKSAEALKNFTGVRGRMENVSNSLGFNIIVDYGCEPESFKASLEAAAQLPHNRLIHVFGSTGGHRDKSKRFEFGRISAEYADYIIVTNDDVYDSDPKEIAGNVELGIRNYELRKPQYEIVLDRRMAIYHALTMAQPGDLILIAGKGSEQFLVLPGNKRVEWDDVAIVREELQKLTSSASS
jgi:UDP-N-acetylmuramoyl-L-alanyl-D-glutamate--2,6-diaminopimelate ligase